MPDIKTLAKTPNITTTVANKTLSKLLAYQHGSTFVVDITMSDGTQTFVKFFQGNLEVGGTNEWNTGTKIAI